MIEYNLAWILPYVRQSIPGLKDIFKFDEFADGVFALLEMQQTPTIGKQPTHTGRTYNEAVVHRDIKFAIVEAFYYCEQNRFILRQPPSHGSYFNRPSFAVSGDECVITARGREWAAGGEPLPEDYNGYMNGLSKLVPNMDKVITQYVAEGLSSFVRDRYFAAAVMIGAASEKAVYLLADSMLASFKDAAQEAKLKKLLDKRSLNALFTFVEKTILDAHAADIIPYALMEGTSRHLMSLVESIRVQRNDAVHPMNAQVSADSVRLSFGAFPHALEKVEALRAWFAANPKSI